MWLCFQYGRCTHDFFDRDLLHQSSYGYLDSENQELTIDAGNAASMAALKTPNKGTVAVSHHHHHHHPILILKLYKIQQERGQILKMR